MPDTLKVTCPACGQMVYDLLIDEDGFPMCEECISRSV